MNSRSRRCRGTPAGWARRGCTCIPTTRRRAGLADGDAVRVHNDRGSFLAAVAVDDATRPGLAFTYKAYWARLSPGGGNVNAVTAVRDTDLGGGPTFHDTRVEVEPVPAELLPAETRATGADPHRAVGVASARLTGATEPGQRGGQVADLVGELTGPSVGGVAVGLRRRQQPVQFGQPGPIRSRRPVRLRHLVLGGAARRRPFGDFALAGRDALSRSLASPPRRPASSTTRVRSSRRRSRPATSFCEVRALRRRRARRRRRADLRDARRLAQFVERGGKLLAFGGENVTPEQTAARGGRVDAGPHRGRRRRNRSAAPPETWDSNIRSSAAFSDPQLGDLRRLAVSACIDVVPADDAQRAGRVPRRQAGARRAAPRKVPAAVVYVELRPAVERLAAQRLPLVYQLLGYQTGLAAGGRVRGGARRKRRIAERRPPGHRRGRWLPVGR